MSCNDVAVSFKTGKDRPPVSQRHYFKITLFLNRLFPEYKREADKLTARLHNDNTLRDEDKAHIYRKIGEVCECT